MNHSSALLFQLCFLQNFFSSPADRASPQNEDGIPVLSTVEPGLVRQRFPPGYLQKGAEKPPVAWWAIWGLLTCDICWWEALKASAGEDDTSRLRDVWGGGTLRVRGLLQQRASDNQKRTSKLWLGAAFEFPSGSRGVFVCL